MGHQIRWSVNMRACIFKAMCFFPETIKRATLSGVQKHSTKYRIFHFRDSWFPHVGASPHMTHPMRLLPNRDFCKPMTGRLGLQPWPARSPDLSLLDFIPGVTIKRVFVAECQKCKQQKFESALVMYLHLYATCSCGNSAPWSPAKKLVAAISNPVLTGMRQIMVSTSKINN